jgi:VWFA-related protein
MRSALIGACIGVVCCLARPAGQVVFRGGVDLVEIDAVVVNGDGRPALGLTAKDFTLRVDGQPRPIESVEFFDARAASTKESSATTETLRRTASRHVLFVVDEGNISAGGGRRAVSAASRMLDQLGPSDRIGVLSIPSGPSVDFTDSHEPVRAALQKVVGRASSAAEAGEFNLNDQELFAFDVGQSMNDRTTQQNVLVRECPLTMPPQRREACEGSLRSEAQGRLEGIRERSRATIAQLDKLFRSLARMSGPKVVILVSEGLLMRPDHRDDGVITTLGAQAAATDVMFYAVLLDGPTIDVDAGGRPRPPSSLQQDRTIREDGLSALAGASGGVLVRVTAAPDAAFERLGHALSGFYIVAFRVLPGDRDGPHQVQLTSSAAGASLHARTQFVKTPVVARTAMPARTSSVKPSFSTMKMDKTTLQVATRSIADANGRVRIVFSLDVLDQAANPVSALALGYKLKAGDRVVAETGQVVPVTHGADGRAEPVSYVAFQGLAPGQYKLEVSASDGSKHTAFVTHPVVANLHAVGAFRLSDLFLAAVAPNAQGPFPSPASVVTSTGEVVMGIDVTAPDASTLADATVQFTILSQDGAELQAGPVLPLAAGGPLNQFVRTTLQVPSGAANDCIARAVLLLNGTRLGEVDAPFRVARQPR